MADLWGRLTAVFSTATGLTVLGLAALALAALVIANFWDTIRLPRRDGVGHEELPTAPPPLLAPQIVSRRGVSGAQLDWTRYVKLAALGIIGLAFVLMAKGLFTSPPTGFAAASLGLDRAASAAVPARAPARSAQDHVVADPLTSVHCEGKASFDEGRFLLCERGAAVSIERLELVRGSETLLAPRWQGNAAGYLAAENHAGPVGLNTELAFAPPPASGLQGYDGILVVGTAPVEDRPTAALRAERLAAFAADTLAGTGPDDCVRSERVFTAVASLAVNDDMEPAEARPLVIGLRADPVSSTPIEDMRAAAEVFLQREGAAFGLVDANLLDGTRVCQRGTDRL
jgi:hypothetical protein